MPAALVALACGACASLGVVEDGTSVSFGKANRGTILSPSRLPDEGDGYRVPVRWSSRGLRYGTDELVDFVVQLSRRVAGGVPGAHVTVADLSPLRGGPSRWHKSHQSGRDVDLVFFAVDAHGKTVDLEDMRRFNRDGVSIDDKKHEGVQVFFDVPRNWAIVRAIVEHPSAHVQHVFVYEPLALAMLDHARATGEPEAIVARARDLMKQPGDSAPHDDHMHVRILCSAADRMYGCRDYGIIDPATLKLARIGMLAWSGWPTTLRQLVASPMPAMLALVSLPILR